MILLLGGTGQLGRAFGDTVRHPPRAQVDLTKPHTIDLALDEYRPEWVINAAAQHDARGAERDSRPDFAVNSAGPHMLARACTKRGIRLLHLSTNYVFGGDDRDGPFVETDPPAPVTMYGIAKWAGEQAVLTTDPRHIVVRTSCLFGPELRDGFPGKHVLRGGDPLLAVADQWVVPTAATDLAQAIQQLITLDPLMGGVYHLVGSGGAVTWYDYAMTVLALTRRHRIVIPTTTDCYGEGVPRPMHSELVNTRAAALGVEMPAWRTSLERHLSQRGVLDVERHRPHVLHDRDPRAAMGHASSGP